MQNAVSYYQDQYGDLFKAINNIIFKYIRKNTTNSALKKDKKTVRKFCKDIARMFSISDENIFFFCFLICIFPFYKLREQAMEKPLDLPQILLIPLNGLFII